MDKITYRDRLSLWVQQILGRIFLPLVYGLAWLWMLGLRGYRIPELKRIRLQYRACLEEGLQRPVLICANHLTLIDSLILIWAFGSPGMYLMNWKFFAWNLPEKRNFYESIPLRILCYLGKCMPVVRQGPAEETAKQLEKVKFLLKSGNSVMIFPEGTRSRTGRIDVENVAYGIGRIIQGVPGAHVLCVYLRGKEQKTYGTFPRCGEEFYLQLRLVVPETIQKGLRGAKELAIQVVQTLDKMEKEYFFELSDNRK